jgi:HPt (histidine-containing phosphotransfer) domain-containing protein
VDHLRRQQEPLDGLALDRLLSLGGEPLLRQMLDAVLDQTEIRLRSAADALAADDSATLRRAAHSLRSGAAYVGATRLEASAGALEALAALAADGRGDGAAAALAAVRADWADVRPRLEERRRLLG